jgi:hypothetical protein
MKRYRNWPIYLLLLLLPMQTIAAANMLVCNSLMQQATINVATEMPCHEQVADTHANLQTHDQQSDPFNQHTSQKGISHCGMLCNSLCGFTGLPATTFNLLTTNRAVLIAALEVDYHSVTLPLLQRPPIFLT